MMKWLRRHFDTCFVVLQVFVDWVVILASCLVAWRIQESLAPGKTHISVYGHLMVVITGITLVCFWFFGLYKWRKSILNVEEYRNTFKATFVSLLLCSAWIFMMRAASAATDDEPWVYNLLRPVHQLFQIEEVDRYSRLMFILIFLVIFLITSMQRAVFFRIISVLHSKGFGNTNVAIFGTGPLALRVYQKLRLFPTLGFHFVGFLDEDPELHGKRIRGYPILGSSRQLDEIARQYQIKRIFMAGASLQEDELVEICGRFEKLGIRYQVIPRLHHFFSKRFTIDKLDSIPLITLRETRGRPIYLAFKRGIDLAVSGLVLVVTSPLMLVIALLIKRESQGPVFFRQVRVGQNGRLIKILKFRTMYQEVCRDEVTPQSSHDPRITRVGNLLRKTSLDELPQFLNVFRGEMSLVGPRPEMPFIVDTYSSVDRLRLEAKPGITGLWQVSEARKSPIHENLDYDLYYIENQSTFLDAVILLMTLFTVFRTRGTY